MQQALIADTHIPPSLLHHLLLHRFSLTSPPFLPFSLPFSLFIIILSLNSLNSISLSLSLSLQIDPVYLSPFEKTNCKILLLCVLLEIWRRRGGKKKKHKKNQLALRVLRLPCSKLALNDSTMWIFFFSLWKIKTTTSDKTQCFWDVFTLGTNGQTTQPHRQESNVFIFILLMTQTAHFSHTFHALFFFFLQNWTLS